MLDVKIPQEISANAVLENGYSFEDGRSARAIVTGTYRINKKA